MPSTINASNSGSGGIVQTADASGVLQLQTTGTTALTIDTSQNVGVGTASLGTIRLNVRGDASANTAGIKISHPSNVSNGFELGYLSSVTSNDVSIWNWENGFMRFATNGSERMRLDSSGNLFLGTTSGSGERFRLVSNVSGYYASTIENNNANGFGIKIRNGNDSNDALRISNAADNADNISFYGSGKGYFAGPLLVGTTSALAGARVEASSTGINHTFYRANATGGNTLGLWLSNAYGTATTAAYFRVDGGLANYSANNANLSDARVKTDIKNAGSYLAKICAIPVKTFKYINLENAEDNLGVIAQDVEAVAPELVDVSGFGETPEDGIPLKAIYQTDLQYALMKCIQEQQALIESLTQRITALEGA